MARAVFPDHLARIHRAVTTATHVDLTDMVAVAVISEAAPVEAPGEVRYYGADTRRWVQAAGGNRETATIGVAFASRDDADHVRTWVGETILVRDGDGRVYWGTLASVRADVVGGYVGVTPSLTLTIGVTSATRAVA